MQADQLSDNDGGFKPPADLKYSGQIVSAPRASRRTTQFLSENASTFTPANNVIRIPVSSSSFLDLSQAVLQFNLKNTDTGACILDGGASCVISRMRITGANGQEIERIDGYNLLAVVLDTYAGTHGQAMQDKMLKGSATPAFAYAQSGADAISAAATKNYCQTLVGAWFNPLAGKLLPPRVQFIVELTLGTAVSCISYATATGVANYEVSSVSINIPAVMVEEPAYMSAMQSRMSSKGVELYGSSYMQYISSLAASTGVENMMINARAVSLEALISVFRTQSRLSVANNLKLSTATISTLSQIQWQIGNQQYPSAPLAMSSTAFSQAYSETAKAFGALNKASPVGIIDGACYVNTEATTYNGNGGFGVLACQFSAYNDPQSMSGLNTADSSQPVSILVTKATAANILQVDTFARFSVQFVISSNGDVLVVR